MWTVREGWMSMLGMGGRCMVVSTPELGGGGSGAKGMRGRRT